MTIMAGNKTVTWQTIKNNLNNRLSHDFWHIIEGSLRNWVTVGIEKGANTSYEVGWAALLDQLDPISLIIVLTSPKCLSQVPRINDILSLCCPQSTTSFFDVYSSDLKTSKLPRSISSLKSYPHTALSSQKPPLSTLFSEQSLHLLVPRETWLSPEDTELPAALMSGGQFCSRILGQKVAEVSFLLLLPLPNHCPFIAPPSAALKLLSSEGTSLQASLLCSPLSSGPVPGFLPFSPPSSCHHSWWFNIYMNSPSNLMASPFLSLFIPSRAGLPTQILCQGQR